MRSYNDEGHIVPKFCAFEDTLSMHFTSVLTILQSELTT